MAEKESFGGGHIHTDLSQSTFNRIKTGAIGSPPAVLQQKIPQSVSMMGFARKDSKLSSKERRAMEQRYGLTKTGASVERFAPRFRDPRLQPFHYYLPQTADDLNEWIRHYDRWHPLVGNIMDLHSQLPMSRFGLEVGDPKVLQFYEDMTDEMDLFELSVGLLREWFLVAEAWPTLFWDEEYNCWTSGELLNSSYIEVRGSYLIGDKDEKYRYFLRPDPALIEFVNSSDPIDQELQSRLDPELIDSVKRGEMIELDKFSTSFLARKQSLYDVRGTPIILRVLYDLLYEDILRDAQMAIAEAHITPKMIWKLGNEKLMPTDDDLRDFRELLIQADNDPIFSLITHYAVNLQIEGSTGRILPLIPEFQHIENRILSGLFSNKAILLGEGPTYQNASVALRALMSRYITIRAMVEDWMYQKVFMPVAIANDFWERKQADLDHRTRTTLKSQSPLIPKINWRHKANLLDDTQVKSMLVQLVSASRLPMRSLVEALDLDWDYTKAYMEGEVGTIFDPMVQEARKTVAQRELGQPTTGPGGEALEKPVDFMKTLKDMVDKFKKFIKGDEVAPDKDQEFLEKGEPTTTDPESRETDLTAEPKEVNPSASKQTFTSRVFGEGSPALGFGEKVKVIQDQYLSRRTGGVLGKKAWDYDGIGVDGRINTAKLVEEDISSREEWQKRLWFSGIGNKERRALIGLENEVVDHFDNQAEEFSKDLSKVWEERGSITIEDLQRFFTDHLEQVNSKSEDAVRYYTDKIYNGGADGAKNVLKRVKKSVRRAQIGGDDRAKRVQEAIDRALTGVTSVGPEVTDRLREMLVDNFGNAPSDAVQRIFEEIDGGTLQGMTVAQIQARLGQLWQQMRPIYQRVVRTEQLNIHTRSQLQEWRNAGYTQVKRHPVKDHKTCPICRGLDGSVWEIDDLLKLDYPLTQDPRTSGFLTHPNCFVDSKVLIFTSKGQKKIRDVRKEDLVLTHKGRFRKVTDVVNGQIPAREEFLKISFHHDPVETGRMGMISQISVTKEHPILTDGGWKLAGDLSLGDRVLMTGTPCSGCGKIVPSRLEMGKEKKYCKPCGAMFTSGRAHEELRKKRKDPVWVEKNSRSLKMAWAKPGAKEKLGRAIRKAQSTPQYKARRSEIGRETMNKRRERGELVGWYQYPGTDHYDKNYGMLKNRMLAGGALKACLSSGRPSRGQVELFEIISGRFSEAVLEHTVRISEKKFYVVDIALPSLKVAVEYDGQFWHKDSAEYDAFRENDLRLAGWNVLRVEEGGDLNAFVDEVERIVRNHEKEYKFAYAVIKSIERRKFTKPKKLWNFDVEEDHSYVAQGVVVHNCRDFFEVLINFNSLNDFTIPAGQSFDASTSFKVGETSVEDTPLEYETQIQRTLGHVGTEADYKFVPDVTQDNSWQMSQLDEIKKENPGISETAARELLNTRISEHEGQITSYRPEEGPVLISGFAGMGGKPSVEIVRQFAFEKWDSLLKDQKDWVEDRYNEKKEEMNKSLDVEGVEIFGSNPFVTPEAGRDPEAYFVEAVIEYALEPFRLSYLDPEAYNFLNTNVFSGREFLTSSLR